MTDDTAWNDHSEQPGTGDPISQAVARQAAARRQAARAITLGTEHGRAGTTPYGDLDFDADSPLFAALGETGPTTEHNHPRRLALLDAYRDAYTQAREGTRS